MPPGCPTASEYSNFFYIFVLGRQTDGLFVREGEEEEQSLKQAIS